MNLYLTLWDLYVNMDSQHKVMLQYFVETYRIYQRCQRYSYQIRDLNK
jgi:hypothetical protein